jgi:shikimate kinase
VVKSTSRNAKISLDSQQTRILRGEIQAADRVTAVALVGFMGAGNTTVGRELARRLKWRFDDLDDLIQVAEGATIEQIFGQRGEKAFREIERRILCAALADNNAPRVLALGGGAFVDTENQATLQLARIPAVFLDAPGEELFERSAQPELVRPLRRDRSQFCQLYEERRPAYLKAAVCIQTSNKEIGQVAQEVIVALKLTPSLGASE